MLSRLASLISHKRLPSGFISSAKIPIGSRAVAPAQCSLRWPSRASPSVRSARAARPLLCPPSKSISRSIRSHSTPAVDTAVVVYSKASPGRPGKVLFCALALVGLGIGIKANNEEHDLSSSQLTILNVEEWFQRCQDQHKDLYVTKLSWRKMFHYCPFFHEFLLATIKNSETNKEYFTIVERRKNNDQAIDGFKPVPFPKLRRFYIHRALRGQYRLPLGPSDSKGAPIPSEIAYSASDELCYIEFDPPIPLVAFASKSSQISKSCPEYNATENNCFWFAKSVYEGVATDFPNQSVETRGELYKMRGMLMGISVNDFFKECAMYY